MDDASAVQEGEPSSFLRAWIFASYFLELTFQLLVQDAVSVTASALRDDKVNTCIYVGAGASASSGVPTFHGHNAAASLLAVREDQIHFPNYTHRAVRELLNRGMADFCVSTNHDGLVTSIWDNVVEIFGSVLTESCLGCKKRFRRQFGPPPLNRKCEECGEKLKKTGCRYGQAIYKPGLERAQEAAEKSDVAIVLGSGMHTWPVTSSGFPGMAKCSIVLVTLGDTVADDDKGITRLDSTCDSFMEALMQELQINVPDFEFSQTIKINCQIQENRVEIQVSDENPQEALTFCHEGRICFASGESFDFDRSNLSFLLTASFTKPASAEGPMRVELIPRLEFNDTKPHVVLMENDEMISVYRKTITLD